MPQVFVEEDEIRMHFKRPSSCPLRRTQPHEYIVKVLVVAVVQEGQRKFSLDMEDIELTEPLLRSTIMYHDAFALKVPGHIHPCAPVRVAQYHFE